MKKYFFYFSILSLILCYSCYEEEIVTSKPGVSIDPVTNLDYSVAGEEIILTWDLPSNYHEDVVQPVSVQINVSIDGRREGGAITLGDNPESYTYTPYDSSRDYRFTVKVMANTDSEDPYVSELSYSLGNTIEVP